MLEAAKLQKLQERSASHAKEAQSAIHTVQKPLRINHMLAQSTAALKKKFMHAQDKRGHEMDNTTSASTLPDALRMLQRPRASLSCP